MSIKDEPARPSSADPGHKSFATHSTKSTKGAQKGTPARSGASYPAPQTSDVDIDAKPIYEPSGKPITEVDLDSGKG